LELGLPRRPVPVHLVVLELLHAAARPRQHHPGHDLTARRQCHRFDSPGAPRCFLPQFTDQQAVGSAARHAVCYLPLSHLGRGHRPANPNTTPTARVRNPSCTPSRSSPQAPISSSPPSSPGEPNPWPRKRLPRAPNPPPNPPRARRGSSAQAVC